MGIWLPFAIIGITRVGLDWFPVQDHAVLDLTLRDYLTGHPRLVGAFSRLGWSHPGPVWFIALLPFRAIFGVNGIIVGSIWWFGAGLATATTLARARFGNRAAVATVFFLLIALLGSGAFTFLHPWNPHMAWAWYPVFLLLGLSSFQSYRHDLWPAVFIGGLIFQLHVSYIVLVGVPLVTALGFAGLSLLHDRKSGLSDNSHDQSAASTLLNSQSRGLLPKPSRFALFWLTLIMLSWIPPLVEQLRSGKSGNMWALAQYFLAPDGAVKETPVGVEYAMGIIGGVTKLPPVGLGGRGENLEAFTGYVTPLSPWWLIIPMSFFILSGAYIWSTKVIRLRQTVLYVTAVLASAIVAVSQLSGELWPYLFSWRFIAVWFAIGTMAMTTICAWGQINRTAPDPVGQTRDSTDMASETPRLRQREQTVFGVTILVFGAVVIGISIPATGSEFELVDEARQLHNHLVESDWLQQHPSIDQIKVVRLGAIFDGVGDALINSLDSQGWPIRVGVEEAFKYGDHRRLMIPDVHVRDHVDTTERWATFFMTEGSIDTSIAKAVSGAELLTSVTPLNDADETRIQALHIAAAGELVHMGRSDLVSAVGSPLVEFYLENEGVILSQVDMAELVRLNEIVQESNSCRCAVTRVPNGTPQSPDTVAESFE